MSTTVPNAVDIPNSKPVAYWLFGMGGLVAGMVTVGGITRLTRSGLSMTDWKLKGNMPPMNLAEWEAEFERYKQFPEWQQRKSMTLDEFKFIYFWEYGHRMMGRSLGFAFAIPAFYFAARGMIPKRLYSRVALLFGLGGAQGLIGWWMVKSGLNMDPEQKKEIRVSPYRLTTHLSMAFTTYCLLIWTALDVLHGPEAMRATAQKMGADVLKHARKVRKLAAVSAVVAATTVVSGAFVAGNDAGRAYNTFPLMDDKIIPLSDMFTMEPTWRNFFENTATVQFDHRVLAMSTLASVLGTYAVAMKSECMKALPAASRRALHHAAGMVLLQVGLGITTLLMYVPVSVAAMHQAGSLVLLTFLTHLVHSLGFVKHAPAAVSGAGAGAGPAAGGRAVAGAMLVVGSAAAARSVGARSVVPYGTKVMQRHAPQQQLVKIPTIAFPKNWTK